MDPHALIQDYLDGEISESDLQLLSQWLDEDEANREAFVRASSMDTLIYRQLVHADLTRFLTDVDMLASEDATKAGDNDSSDVFLETMDRGLNNSVDSPRHDMASTARTDQGLHLKEAMVFLAHVGLRKFGTTRLIGAAAAILALAVTVTILVTRSGEPDPQPIAQRDTPAAQTVGVATLTEGIELQWVGQSPVTGQPLIKGQYELERGTAVLQMESDAEVLIHGPASFQLTGANKLSLRQGRLIARVPSQAVGFTVDTPTARIVDIGTQFDINVDRAEQHTRVQVHQGEVRAASVNEEGHIGAYTSLYAEQAAAITPKQGLQKTAYLPSNYENELAQTRRLMPRVTGGLSQWSATMPSDLRQGKQRSDALQVFLEASGLALDQDVAVDLTGTDRWPIEGRHDDRTISAGQGVDVYLIHIDTFDRITTQTNLYTIDFGRPIVGVIGKRDKLVQTDALVDDGSGRLFAGTGEDTLRGIEVQDLVKLNADGTSIDLRLQTDYRIDQIRVLVRAVSATE